MHSAPRPILRRVKLPTELTSGSLYLSSMPGRYAPLEEFLTEIRAAGVSHILCLVSDEEIAEKSPEYLEAIETGNIPASLIRSTIPDYGLPADTVDLRKTLSEIQQRLDGGDSVVIHCAAGCGRTGMIAIVLLITMGIPLVQAYELVHSAGSGPDTDEQGDFVRRWD